MTGKTSIEWATAVWNPTTGCTRVSAGCDNCYAFALHDKRYAMNRKVASPVAVRDYRDSGGGKALPWQKQYDLPFSRVQLLPDRLDHPLRRRKPERYFVDSMADLFHKDVPDEFIAQVFDTMRLAEQHTFLVLTKRPERMRELIEEMGQIAGAYDFTDDGGEWPLPNVWLGTSVEDQRAADERIPHLLATPAAVRFLSCEPLLGPVDLSAHTRKSAKEVSDGEAQGGGRRSDGVAGRGELDPRGHGHDIDEDHEGGRLHRNRRGGDRLDWVIIGGESGPRARPMDLAWARSLVSECRAAGVAPFVKQLGSAPVQCDNLALPLEPFCLYLRDHKGGDMDEWPEDLRVREFPR